MNEWEARKQKIREAEWSRLAREIEVASKPTGRARGATPTAKPAPPEAPSDSPDATPTPTTSGTFATDTVSLAETPAPLLTSSTSAEPTSTNSNDPTVWGMSPIGFVESDSATSISTLRGLPERHQRTLEALAAGRNEPVGVVIQEIAAFFVESESEWAEAPLVDALGFYLTQYVDAKALGVA